MYLASYFKRQLRGNLGRRLLLVIGTICVGLGVVGVFLPLLPTTPFLLLAAACYARSSQRFSNWLLGNRLLGKAIRDYREGRGLPLKLKALVLALLWATIGSTAVLATESVAVRAILIVIAVGVTAHILSIRRAKRDPASPDT